MFNSPYKFYYLGPDTQHLSSNPDTRLFYKFRAKHRTYLVTLEVYSFNLVAIKYCDLRHKGSKNAYDEIFNDGDASRVIGTCFHIMRAYFLKHRDVNFVFYASIRGITEQFIKNKKIAPIQLDFFIDQYRKVRYRIYRYGMLNLFPFEYFHQVEDKDNCIYALLNKKHDPATILEDLRNYLLEHHDTIFTPNS